MPAQGAGPRLCLGAALLTAGLWSATTVLAQEADGDGTVPPLVPAETLATGASGSTPLFKLDIQAPAPLDDFVRRHAELQRFQELPDLTRAELERLLLTAPEDIRRLLGSQGYFSPGIDIRLLEPAAAGAGGWTVRIAIEPGPLTRIADVRITLHGDVLDNPAAAEQRDRLQAGWRLPVGQPFTQQAWDEAKSQALRTLTQLRYPAATITSSLADIDPASQQAHLVLELDSGQAYRFGEIEVEGSSRYAPEMVLHLLQFAGVRPGQTYDESLLQVAQQRLVDSGYYESAFVLLDTGANPEHATVQVRVREALRQKLVVGVGASTDNGARLSLEHTHHRVPGLDWRATSKLQLERDKRTLNGGLSSPVDWHGWRWDLAAQLQRQEDGKLVTDSQQLRAGRSQTGRQLDRQFFVQYDRAHTTDPALAVQAPSASSLSANYGWTRRAFDDLAFPTRGQGLAVELGAGLTLSQEKQPYLRARARWQAYLPQGEASERPSRWSLRLEGGAVWSRDDTLVPATQRFLAGGDGSVRGYGLRDIGVPRASGGVDPGRLLAVASLEWQRPLWLDGRRSAWETVLFLDAGAVADRTSELDPKVGIGTGVRYRSPVGPLQLDLAYGLERRAFRLHMSVGFTF